MIKLLRKIFFPILKKVYEHYSSTERTYKYKNIEIKILPGVFHPGFFFSTKFLLSHLEKISIQDKSVLELGAGTGLISVYCSNQGAKVTATDISKKAIENISLNSEINNCNIIVIESDLFDNIQKQEFDLITINPPYFPSQPKNEKELTWFCGENFEYFHKMFRTIGNYFNKSSMVLIVLSEVTDIEKIVRIAEDYTLKLEVLEKRKFWGEQNFIYTLKKSIT